MRHFGSFKEMEWHVINLTRRKDRWDHVHRHFHAGGFRLKRFPAVDSRTLSPSLRNPAPGECHYHEQRANFNAVACALSHAQLLTQLYENSTDPNEIFLVAEDDCVFPDAARVKDLIRAFASQTTCNVLNLGFGTLWQPTRHEQIADGLWRSTGKSILMHAYAIKRSVVKAVAHRIREGIVQLCLGHDRRNASCDVVWVFADGVVHCIPDSPAAVQLESTSDIETT